MLQTKYTNLESRARDLLLQQNSYISAATSSLSGLHQRLDGLVESLVTSYNITEQDLEVSSLFVQMHRDFSQ